MKGEAPPRRVGAFDDQRLDRADGDADRARAQRVNQRVEQALAEPPLREDLRIKARGEGAKAAVGRGLVQTDVDQEHNRRNDEEEQDQQRHQDNGRGKSRAAKHARAAAVVRER